MADGAQEAITLFDQDVNVTFGKDEEFPRFFGRIGDEHDVLIVLFNAGSSGHQIMSCRTLVVHDLLD